MFKMNAARNMMAVGMMYVAFGAIAVGTIASVMQMSKLGESVMTSFSNRINKSLAKLGTAFAEILEPILNVVATILEMVTAHPILTKTIALLVLFGASALLLAGVIKVLSGGLLMVTTMMGVKAMATTAAQKSLLAYIPTTQAATVATYSLAGALKAVGIGFTIGFSLVLAISGAFGKMAGIIAGVTITVIALAIALWSAAGALSVLTFGAAAIAGGAAIATAIVAAQPEFKMGTSFVRKTGFALVHAGEEIKSARESPMASARAGGGFSRSHTEVTLDFSGSTIQTKADKEELLPWIKRAMRESLRAKE